MFPTRFIAQASLLGVIGLSSPLIALPLVTPAVMAQTASDGYNGAMQKGYGLTARRDYQSALVNFKKALSLRPGDRYATVAISNVQAYIARDRVANRPVANRLAYIPSHLGMPGNTVAGATRGTTCTPGSVKLTALAPNNGLALTASKNPDLFFYVPASSAKAIELIVSDEQGNLIEQRTYGINPTAGIVKVKLNGGSNGLEVGKKYKWNFSLVCSSDPSGFPYVEGWVERVDLDPNMLQAINSTPVAERLPLYAANQIWNDTLTALVQLQQSSPSNSSYQDQWQTYLQEAGVDPGIATMPILDCCQAQ
ncbi:DUF928 domain-containing protein [Synechococcus sp. PCC 6312]|uniref:DUF928 domain-containing protein n=1 Tax=Synechococcus sp. (strain ATCC 27167 / PCC 6312) TaxID=195253 RepID=UPI00029ED36E|nr:DUF928 domain-containing protein [Synechococcus sp. PCC 6312]AFY61052.1 protein of unknown function (DUF928) [Synechococcus sp. PCC 6312]